MPGNRLGPVIVPLWSCDESSSVAGPHLALAVRKNPLSLSAISLPACGMLTREWPLAAGAFEYPVVVETFAGRPHEEVRSATTLFGAMRKAMGAKYQHAQHLGLDIQMLLSSDEAWRHRGCFCPHG